MTKICCATIVKDEDDIIREWIEYYGKLFSYENLYIIDNYSMDNTYQICKEYVDKGIHLTRESDYKRKGEYMTEIMKRVECDFFIPIDIDEFIVFYNKPENTIESTNVISYFDNLKSIHPTNALFKMNYIWPVRTNNDPILLKQFTHGVILNYGINAKSFLQSIPHNFQIDHGNHMAYNNYILTDLYVIHYHRRSDHQHKKKTINNVVGLGHHLDLNYLKNLGHVAGQHHVENAISILENPTKSNEPPIETPDSTYITFHKYIDFLTTNKICHS